MYLYVHSHLYVMYVYLRLYVYSHGCMYICTYVHTHIYMIHRGCGMGAGAQRLGARCETACGLRSPWARECGCERGARACAGARD